MKIKYRGDPNKYWITIDRNVQHILDDETDKPKFIKKIRKEMRKVKTQNPGDQKMHNLPDSSEPVSFHDIYEHHPWFTQWLLEKKEQQPIYSKEFRRYLDYVKFCESGTYCNR